MNNKRLLAIGVCIVIAIIATFLGGLQNIIGGPMIGLLIGMLVVNIVPPLDKEFQKGTSWAGKKFLNLGIILTGATLNFNQVLGLGAKAMPLLLVNMAIAFTVAFYIGKKLKVSENTSILVGSGTSICGGTAIATMSSVIGAKESEIAYAMTAIFLFDVVSALAYPYVSTALNLTHNQFAFLAGTSINDTASVTASEATYNALNGIDGNIAVTIKLARTTLLILLVVIGTVINARRTAKATATSGGGSADISASSMLGTIVQKFPKFILVFLLMAILNTAGIFNGISWASSFFKKFSKFFITTALAGVGFKVRFNELLTEGRNPIILGGLTWTSVCISSVLFITIFANYVG